MEDGGWRMEPAGAERHRRSPKGERAGASESMEPPSPRSRGTAAGSEDGAASAEGYGGQGDETHLPD